MIKRGNEKSSGGLSKSTKTLLIIVIAIMLIAVIFLVVRGLSNQNNNETPVDKLTADLQISQVEIVNTTSVNVKVGEGTVEGTMQAINFIFYDENGAKILTRKILSSELEKNDFQISFRVTNTSKIKSISITPVFTSTEGKSVVGQVEDEYTISAEEYPNNNENNESNQEENTTQTEEQPSCTLDFDCNDNNSCTTDTCVNGNCSYTPIDSCVPCSLSSQCDDSNACTANVCSDGKCSYPAIPGCTPCGSNLNCEDNNSCTNNICFQGRCSYTSVLGCQSCTLDSECDDNEACTTNTCLNGACTFTSISGCKICTLNSQCDDNDSSTTFACLSGKCNYTKITSCKNNDEYCPSGCNAGNDNDCSYICGNGVREGTEKCDGASLGGATCAGVLGTGYTGTLKCFSGLCTFDTSLCVAPCTCSDDSNICTTDQCVNNVCQHTAISGCCTSASQCNDNNICTTDSCSGNNLCSHSTIASCCISSSQCASGQTCTGNVCVSSSNPPTATCGDGTCNGGETCSSCSQDCGTCYVPLKTYYISQGGSDSTGNGSSAKPWKSLSYACFHVTTSGSLIHVTAGTYTETSQCNLAVGVSIEGEGDSSSIIKSTIGNVPTIYLYSPSVTSGNQHISGIKLDGNNLVAYEPLVITKRSYVEVHDCTFVNFMYSGVSFYGEDDGDDVIPNNFCINNKFYNNRIINCASFDIVGSPGNLQIDAQQGMRVYNNSIIQTARGARSDGFGLKCVQGLNKDLKIYNNTIIVDGNDDDYWTFAMEFWDSLGGIEIYNNRIQGVIDLAGHLGRKGSYDYTYSVHDNIIGHDYLKSTRRDGIYLENVNDLSDVIIYNNLFKNLESSILLETLSTSRYSNILIYYNIFYNIGMNVSGSLGYGFSEGGQSGYTLNNLKFYNNVFIPATVSGMKAIAAIQIPSKGTITNVDIKNNIIQNFNSAPIEGNSGTLSGISIQNNIFYNNGNSNSVSGSTSGWSGYTNKNNYPGINPSLTSDFHLNSGSPAINAGVNVGLTLDKDGKTIVGLPDIGAYEYSSTSVCTCSSDNNVCTTDQCVNNVCQHTAIGGCCTSSSQCVSGQTCTGNICVTSSLPPTSTTGKMYYLSPFGSDTTGNGSITKPWFTLSKAWTYLTAGDTLYLRGGTYAYSTRQTLEYKNGVAGNMINIWAYPGEIPIFTDTDNFNDAGNWPDALIFFIGDYFYWKGLEISYVEQKPDGTGAASMAVLDSDNNIFEQFNVHHNTNGFEISGTSTGNLVLNSDFHHNNDPYGVNADGTPYPYGNADGVAFDFTAVGVTNTLRGCRMWWNSDDGLDLYDGEGNVIVDNCWSWYNGFAPGNFDNGGDGNGFKLGATQTNLPTTVLRTVTNSLSVYNKGWGFLDNAAECNMKLYNNIAYQNCYKGYVGWCGGFNFNLVPGIAYYIKNNVAYETSGSAAALDVLTNVNHNSWDTSGVSADNNDFLNIDVSQLLSPRNSDGSLPTNITFLHLKQGSDLINAGVNVGLSSVGAPDLGPFETNY